MSPAAAGNLRTIYRHLSPERRRQLSRLMLLTPVTAVAEMLLVAAIVPFLGALDPSHARHGLLDQVKLVLPLDGVAATALLFIASAILVSALRLILSRATLRFAADLGHELNMEIQRRMLHQPYLFHVAGHSSRLLAALEKVDELVLGFAMRGLQLASAVVIALAVILTLLLIDARSALVAVGLVAILYGAALLVVRRRFQRSADVVATAHQHRIKLAQDNLGGIRDIVLDQSQEAHLAQFGVIDRPFMQARTEISFLAIAPRFLVEGIGLGLLALAALAISARPGGLIAALPVLGALALGALRLFPLAGQVYGGWVSMAASGPTLREVAHLLSLPMSEPRAPPQALPFERSIDFEDVSLSYPGRDHPALHGISLSIPGGARVAIVGATGSGKSTLADLLMGLIEPSVGQVRVDGELLSGPALAAWRQSVAHVPQSIFLADTSIARNITLGRDEEDALDMARIVQAARTAQLHDFIMSLPGDYGTLVGEAGIRLSGGQRQRLALARAIYKQAPVLILDEATSALDEATEEAVLTALDALQDRGQTIVVIAHRLSTVQRCDRIFLLDGGQLLQSGSFTELFGRLNRLKEQGAL